MVLTKEEIREIIRNYEVWLTEDRVAMLPAVVDESRNRFIVQITFTGDQQVNRTADIEKLEEDASYTMKFSNIPIAPAAMVNLAPNEDIEQPILVMHGGSQLYGSVSGNSLQVMTRYWDDEVG